MTTEQVVIDSKSYNKAVRKGLMSAFWLAVLTVIEFIVFSLGDGESWLTLALLPFVFAKGWIILDAFMHIKALWGDDH